MNWGSCLLTSEYYYLYLTLLVDVVSGESAGRGLRAGDKEAKGGEIGCSRGRTIVNVPQMSSRRPQIVVLGGYSVLFRRAREETRV
jgi:hypothetical protein